MGTQGCSRRRSRVHFGGNRWLGRIVLLCVVIFVVGGLADRLTQVSPTVRDRATSQGEPTTLVALAGRLGGQNYFRPYLEIGRFSPHATIILDDRVPTGVLGEDLSALVHEPYLYALTGAVELNRERFDVWLPLDAQATASGSYMGQDWNLYLLEPGSAGPELLVWEVNRGLVIADARLVAGRDSLSHPFIEDDSADENPRLWKGVLIDVGLLAALFVLGGMLIPADGFSSVVRGCLAVTVGLGLQVGAGLLRLPGVWSVLLTTAACVGLSRIARRLGHHVGWSRRDAVLIGSGVVSISILSFVARWSGFVWATEDSINYLAQSRMLADGFFSTRNFELKRGIGQQSIHAPGFSLGAEGLQSLGMTVLVLAVILIAALPLALRFRRPSVAWVISAMLAAGLLAAPAFTIMASYVNSHALVALMMLAVSLLLGLQRSRSDCGLKREYESVWATSVLVSALVLLRPEGTLLASLILLGTLRAARPALPAIWHWLGLTTITWNGVLVRSYLERGEPPARIVIVMLAVGVGLVLTPTVLRLLTPGQLRAVPLLAGSAIWAITVLVLRNFEQLRFLNAAVINMGEAKGRWGSFGLMLLLLGVVAVALPERPTDGPGLLGARWALVVFPPLSLFSKLGDGLQKGEISLGVLLSGGGRPGWGDSVNRMWTHAILLVLMLVIVRFTQRCTEDEEADHDNARIQIGSGA